MDISSLGGVASAYSYANQIRNKSVSSSDFASSLNKATSSDNVVEAYKNSLQSKFGCPITVTSVGKDQNSMDRFAGGTAGSGNVAIAPNILEQMANDPEKATYYEKKIQEHFDSLPATEAFFGAHNLRMTTSGVTIHEDGTVTYYCSCEETPEYKAKVEADHKAKREKEAKERQESIERSQEAADERRRIQEEIYQKRSIEAALNEQMLGSGIFAFGDTPESVLTAYGAGVSIPNGSDL
ncbi:MAG: hypothetical protein J5525_08915 [Lachnospiraceae bacterium]|nr:hypothetical protein [Lachnospiraceae bacterium]